jgi:heat shock protein HslJ
MGSVASAVLGATCASLMLANAALAQVPTPGGPLESTAWRWVHSVVGDDTVVVPVDRDRYTVTFGVGGLLSVRADCNTVSGTYHQIGRRLSLQLGPSTLAACPPDSQADEFLRQLGAVVSQVSIETTLVLNLRLDAGSMIFEAQPALSLGGTNWMVLAYNNGRGAVTTVQSGTAMTVDFGADGIVSGNAGCNTYSGSYSYSDDEKSVSIGPLATTRMACPEPVMAEEQAFLTALQASTQYEITSERLTLRNADGAIQVDLLPPSQDSGSALVSHS